MTQKILVVDDSRTVRTVVEWVFHGSPYSVTSASTASEAGRAVRELLPSLVLVDYSLPDQSGFALCRELREDPALADVRLVILGGGWGGFDEARVKECGADDFIMKPFMTDALIEKVAAVLARDAHASDVGLPPEASSPTGHAVVESDTSGRESAPTPAALSLPDVPAPAAADPFARHDEPVSDDLPIETVDEVEDAGSGLLRTASDSAEIEQREDSGDGELPSRQDSDSDSVSTDDELPSRQDSDSDSVSTDDELPSRQDSDSDSGDYDEVDDDIEFVDPDDDEVDSDDDTSPAVETAGAPPPPPAAAVRRPASGAQPPTDVGRPSTSDTAEVDAVPAPAIAAAPAVDAPSDAAVPADFDDEQLREIVRELLPGIVKEALATLLNENVGARLQALALGKVERFVENDLPRMAQEAIDKKLDG
jgi:CheY-like chemotaxis protein